MELDEPICAIASAPGRAPRGIIRVSGRDVVTVVEQLLPAADEEAAVSPTAARRTRRAFTLTEGPADLRRSVPVDLHVWPTSRSYTGQPMAELHLVGSPPILELALERLVRNGCRLARPGEFTLRAFLAGRMDLTQAEAVLGVIDAESEHQLQTALTQLAGGLSRRLGDLREQLLCDLADLEAGLDFVEEDIEFVSRTDVRRRVQETITDVTTLLRVAETRHRDAARPQVVLVGLPNAGKSTLFNALTGRDQAIVSDVAGTTRDVVQATAEIDGLSVDLFDTAGWEAPSDEIMAQATGQRVSRLEQADVVIWCDVADATELEQAASRELRARLLRPPDLDLLLKCDDGTQRVGGGPGGHVSCSVKSGFGMAEVIRAIADQTRRDFGRRDEIVPSTAVRCREELRAALTALESAIAALDGDLGDEVISMELRQALDRIGEITGAVSNEDVLDRLFARFCIGK